MSTPQDGGFARWARGNLLREFVRILALILNTKPGTRAEGTKQGRYPDAAMNRSITFLPLLCVLALGCMKAPDATGMNGPTTAAASPPQVTFPAPTGWTAVAPDQSFYLAKWEVEGGGVATLSWLGAGAGPDFIVSNVERWLGEWQQPGGGAVADYAFDTSSHGGRKTHRVELGGTLTATRQLGGGDAREGWRLFGAVVESEAGPLFLKFIGPAALIEGVTEACWSAVGVMQVSQGG